MRSKKFILQALESTDHLYGGFKKHNLKVEKALSKEVNFKYRTLQLGTYKMFFTYKNGNLEYSFI